LSTEIHHVSRSTAEPNVAVRAHPVSISKGTHFLAGVVQISRAGVVKKLRRIAGAGQAADEPLGEMGGRQAGQPSTPFCSLQSLEGQKEQLGNGGEIQNV
jgi:hypothetical protein